MVAPHRWYHRDGRPGTIEEVTEELQDPAKKILKQERTPAGHFISTVWLGLNHAWEPGAPPLIFETMVFPGPELGMDLDCARYSTEAEALAGNAAMVEKWRGIDKTEDESVE